MVVLDEIPLTRSASWTARAARAGIRGTTGSGRRRTPVEEIVAEVFAEVLGSTRVGADDDFFALGGNSLIATRVSARVGAALDTHVPVRVIFEAPTVAALAARSSARRSRGRPALGRQRARPDGAAVVGAAADVVPEPVRPGARRPTTFRSAIRLTGPLDVAALRAGARVMSSTGTSHCAPSIPIDGGIPVPAWSCPPTTLHRDLDGRCPSEPTTLASRIGEFGFAGFDVTAEAPMRVRLYAVDGVDRARARARPRGAPHQRRRVVRRRRLPAMWSRLCGADRRRGAGVGRRCRCSTPTSRCGSARCSVPRTTRSRSSRAADRLLERTTRGAARAARSADGPTAAGSCLLRRAIAWSSTSTRELQRGLAELAREDNSTLFMVVHAALAVLLARLRVPTTSPSAPPIAGRGEAALDDVCRHVRQHPGVAYPGRLGGFVRATARRGPRHGSCCVR